VSSLLVIRSRSCTTVRSRDFHLAHRSLTKPITVFEAYNFTDPGVGTYKLVPDSAFYVVDEKDEVGVIHADIAEPYTAQVDGPTLAVARADELSSRGLTKRASYVGCSAARQTVIARAIARAEVYASEAEAYLTTHRTSTPRFTTWFGTFAAARHAIVLSHFTSIDSNNFSSFTYDCTCTRASTFAFVYPAKSVFLPFYFLLRDSDVAVLASEGFISVVPSGALL